MRSLVIGSVGVALLAVVALTAARADKDNVPLEKLPKAVADAVKAKFDGAVLVSASKEKEDGKELYEVALKHKGHNIDVTLTAEGKITSIEKQIEAKDFPKPVSEALDAKYPKATIKKAEEVTEGDKVVYEALIVTADNKTIEVVLDPKGKIVKEEPKEEKKKEEKKDK
jgi:uncharacterized membrane protein YkoI